MGFPTDVLHMEFPIDVSNKNPNKYCIETITNR